MLAEPVYNLVSRPLTASTARESMEALLARAREYIPEDKLGVIEDAYRFAEFAHHGQLRMSGEPFIVHPLQTAIYLADLKLDSSALAAALLHDVLEDCEEVSYEDLEGAFGNEIAHLVDGVTKLTQTEAVSEERDSALRMTSTDGLAQAATLRKMLMTMAEDIRVVLIKLADRLHNMRTLDSLPLERRRVFAQETLDIYAPLAHRLGIWEAKWQLEDLAFQHIDPDSYRAVSELLASKREAREAYIEKIIELLQAELREGGIKAEVSGRPKNIYSIHKKIRKYAEQNRSADEIYDLFALRVLVQKVSDCYGALGAIHSRWYPIPASFDDYIANPKDNLYRSLHTVVLAEEANPVEIQIRTFDMHSVSEYGVAAHWLYKEGSVSDVQFEEKMTWLRQLLEWQRDVTSAEEFVESFKTDIFNDQVFVYTPKGEVKELPANSTSLDFAYRIHTDVGHRCIGSKVNGKLVSLSNRLQNGDTVEILTAKTERGPSLDWLNPESGYVRSGSARSKIRQWFNRQERDANLAQGREIYNKQLRRLTTDMDNIDLARLTGFETRDELFIALGNGTVTVSQVVNRLTAEDVSPQPEKPIKLPTMGPAAGIEVMGVGDLLTRMAGCCNPIRGDRIVGYITRNRGVTVHRPTCPNVLAEDEKERLVPVGWGESHEVYPVRVRLEAWDRVGLLGDVTSLVSNERVNIGNCVSEPEHGLTVITLTVYVKGINQLSRLFSKLEGVKGVILIDRVRSGT